MRFQRIEATRWLKEHVPLRHRRRLTAGRLTIRSASSKFRGLPDCLVIGAQRSGTSSLYKYLGAHPHMVPSLRKETEYFSTRYYEGEHWYRAHFPLRVANHGRVSFEATPDYLLDPRAAERAARCVPDARLIAMVRNPIDRAYSQYQHNRRLGHEPLGFEDALEAEPGRVAMEIARLESDPRYRAVALRRHGYVARGMYAQQIRLWLHHFPFENLLVVRFEDLTSDPAETLREIESFVGVGDWLPASFANHSYGLDGRSVHDAMSAAARSRLSADFEAPNRDLEQLLGRSLGWSEHEEDSVIE